MRTKGQHAFQPNRFLFYTEQCCQCLMVCMQSKATSPQVCSPFFCSPHTSKCFFFNRRIFSLCCGQCAGGKSNGLLSSIWLYLCKNSTKSIITCIYGYHRAQRRIEQRKCRTVHKELLDFLKAGLCSRSPCKGV